MLIGQIVFIAPATAPLFDRLREINTAPDHPLRNPEDTRLRQTRLLSLRLRVKWEIEFSLFGFLHPVRKICNQCHMVLNHLAERRCCP